MKVLYQLLLLVQLCTARLIEASDSNFHLFYDHETPIFVYFYAPWCKYCVEFSPVFEQLSSFYEHARDKIKFIKVDGDENKGISRKYKIEAFPTVLLLEGETRINVFARSIKQLEKVIREKYGVLSQPPDVEVKPGIKFDKRVDVDLMDLERFSDIIDGTKVLAFFAKENTTDLGRIIDLADEVTHYYRRQSLVKVALVDLTNPEDAKTAKELYDVDLDTDDAELRFIIPQLGNFKFNETLRLPLIHKRFHVLSDEIDILHETMGIIDIDWSLFPDYQALLDDALTKDTEYERYYREILGRAMNSTIYLNTEFVSVTDLISMNLKYQHFKNFKIKQNILRKLLLLDIDYKKKEEQRRLLEHGEL